MRAALDWILRERKYWKPRSMTWWMGALMVTSGVLRMNGLDIPYISPVIRPILDQQFGSNPGVLITGGLALIGVRAAPGVAGRTS